MNTLELPIAQPAATGSSIATRTLFKTMLAVLGKGMEVACRHNADFRIQVTRHLTIEVCSADGVAHHYVFSPRKMASRPGAATDATLSLTFANARQGLLALASPHAPGKIVHALLYGGATYRGNATLVLWFFPLTRFVLPIGKIGPLRKPLPDAYIAHDPHSKVASRIIREPAVEVLDPNWHDAWARRARMVMPRGSAGESVAMW